MNKKCSNHGLEEKRPCKFIEQQTTLNTDLVFVHENIRTRVMVKTGKIQFLRKHNR